MNLDTTLTPSVTLAGFGQPAEARLPKNFNAKSTVLKIARYSPLVFAAMLIGTLCGGLIGLAIGSAVGIGLALTIELIKQIVTRRKQKRLLLSPEILKKIPENNPKLGNSTGANLRLADDAVIAFEWKKKLCENANESIEISPNYGGGERFREFLSVIEKRMAEKPNLKVHMICSEEMMEKEDLAYLNLLKNNNNFKCVLTKGLVQISDNRLTSSENHVKLLVVDGKYFAAGGNAINDVQTCEVPSPDYNPKNLVNKHLMPKSFRDADVMGEGPIASTMRSEFFKLYSLWEQKITGKTESHYFPLVEEPAVITEFDQEEGLFKQAKISLFVSGPEHGKNNAITNLYHQQIASAKSSITFASPQFNPNKKIKKILLDKKDQIKITGIFNRNVQPLMVVLPSRANYGPFHSVYEYNQGNMMYHKKIMVIDEKRVIIGSYNISKKSDRFDNEIAVLIEDENFAKQVTEMLKEDIKKSEKYDTNTFKAKVCSVAGSILESFVGNLT